LIKINTIDTKTISKPISRLPKLYQNRCQDHQSHIKTNTSIPKLCQSQYFKTKSFGIGACLTMSAHCIWDSDTQTWTSDITFVPAYASGSDPYGTWVWRTVAAMQGWTQQRNFNYDTAVILVATSDEGQHIQDVTGSLGMTRNMPKAAYTDAYGYPVNIHQEQELVSCSDQSTAASIPQLPSFNGVRLPCNMTGGSSGGPRTQNNDEQTSVNSFGIVDLADVMFGPYFGDAVYNLWNAYQDQ
jgi:hypothetical protein